MGMRLLLTICLVSLSAGCLWPMLFSRPLNRILDLDPDSFKRAGKVHFHDGFREAVIVGDLITYDECLVSVCVGV